MIFGMNWTWNSRVELEEKEKLVMVAEKLAARLLLPLVISVGRLRGMRRIA